MSPNPFSGLLHSRKFWLAVLDMVLGLATYFVGKYAPAAADDVKLVFVSIQPVIVIVIASIAWEDTVNMRAAADIERAKSYEACFAKKAEDQK